MKHIILALLLIATVESLQAQSIIWTGAAEVPSGGMYGSTRPRVAVCNGVPVFVWSNMSTKKVYASRYASGSFSTPAQITPGDVEAFCADWTGPEVGAKDDTLFVTFTDNNTPPGPAYVVRSIDGGISFGDTVRVPLIGDEVPRFPAVSVLNNGNPVVTLMRFDAMFDNPDFTVSRSMNGGNSFMPYVDATGPIAGEPCDCCPGLIVTSGNRVAVLYRNNNSNIRDMWGAFSFDGGNTFTNTARIDSNNWMLMSCPSSGPAGYMFDDTLVSVFMNGAGSNGNTVYINSMDLNTMEVQQQRKIFSTMTNTNQNYPRIAGTSDTLGVVWKQTVGSASKIMFSGSFNGPNEIGNTIDTLTGMISGAHASPDIAYGGGWLHVVYENQMDGKLYYMAAAIDTATTIPNNIASIKPSSIKIISITNKEVVVELNDLVAPGATLRLRDVSGRIISTHNIANSQGKILHLNTNNLSSGTYLLQYLNYANTDVKKLEIIR